MAKTVSGLNPPPFFGFLPSDECQVLPGRTHPMMAMSGSGGFLVHATKMQVVFCGLKFTLTEPFPAMMTQQQKLP